ncbi:MAG: hypothetical protein ACE5HS_18710 [bacterium]
MNNMTNFIIILVLLIAVGCHNDNSVSDEKMTYREIAWRDLTEIEKATVIGDWRKAEVQFVVWQGIEVAAVIFHTTDQELLGPITVFINVASKQVVGRALRD